MTSLPNVAWYLSVECADVAGVPVLHLSGRLGSGSSAAVTHALFEAAGSGSHFGVVVDLEGVDYLSSGGLRALESAAVRLASQRRELILCGARGSVSLALLFCGRRPNIAVEPSAELAVRRATIGDV